MHRERCPVINKVDYNVLLDILGGSASINGPREPRMYRKKIRMYKLVRADVHDPWMDKVLPRLTINGRIVLPKEEIAPCIAKFHKEIGGGGSPKVVAHLKKFYYGIGKSAVQYVMKKQTKNEPEPKKLKLNQHRVKLN